MLILRIGDGCCQDDEACGEKTIHPLKQHPSVSIVNCGKRKRLKEAKGETLSMKRQSLRLEFAATLVNMVIDEEL